MGVCLHSTFCDTLQILEFRFNRCNPPTTARRYRSLKDVLERFFSERFGDKSKRFGAMFFFRFSRCLVYQRSVDSKLTGRLNSNSQHCCSDNSPRSLSMQADSAMQRHLLNGSILFSLFVVKLWVFRMRLSAFH